MKQNELNKRNITESERKTYFAYKYWKSKYYLY